MEKDQRIEIEQFYLSSFAAEDDRLKEPETKMLVQMKIKPVPGEKPVLDYLRAVLPISQRIKPRQTVGEGYLPPAKTVANTIESHIRPQYQGSLTPPE